MSILFTNVRVAPVVDAGTGGREFVATSGQHGFALVGMLIRSGAWIDQVTPLFSELLEDGSVGPEVPGTPLGGPGGTTWTALRVTPGYVAVGMQSRSGSYVDAVRLLEAAWDGKQIGPARWTTWVGGIGGGSERLPFIAEPEGRAMIIGLAGRAGSYVDSLTVITGEAQHVTTAALQYDNGTTKKRGSASAALG